MYVLGNNIWIHMLYKFICYTNLYNRWIHRKNLFPCLRVHSLMTLLSYYNSSNTLMKLATGSKWRITSFENAAQGQLQTSSLSSKLSVRDDIVNECLYICNQNFNRRVHFNCVAVSDENWILWNFYDKELITLTYLSKFQNFMMCIMFK